MRTWQKYTLSLLVLVLFAGLAFGTALTDNRNTPRVSGDFVSLTVKNDEVIYAGSLVSVDVNGEAVSASDSVTNGVVGRAESYVDNAADGEVIKIRRGIFRWINGAAYTDANIGEICYVLDDQTVATAASNTYDVIVGTIIDVDDSGVWVDTKGKGGVLDESLTVGGNVLPTTDDTYNLGSTTYEWKDLWIDGIANVDVISNSVAINIPMAIITSSITNSGAINTATIVASGDGTFNGNLLGDNATVGTNFAVLEADSFRSGANIGGDFTVTNSSTLGTNTVVYVDGLAISTTPTP